MVVSLGVYLSQTQFDFQWLNLQGVYVEGLFSLDSEDFLSAREEGSTFLKLNQKGSDNLISEDDPQLISQGK
jgi:hypothetical protein